MSGGSASSLRRRQSVSDSATTENSREGRAALPDYGNPNARASSASPLPALGAAVYNVSGCRS